MYKCEICGKEYENIEDRVACETKCLHDRKVAEEKRKKIKLEQEKETRKQEIQIALGNKRLEVESKEVMNKIDNRHREANKITQEALEEIFTPVPESDYNIAEMQADLEDLLK